MPESKKALEAKAAAKLKADKAAKAKAEKEAAKKEAAAKKAAETPTPVVVVPEAPPKPLQPEPRPEPRPEPPPVAAKPMKGKTPEEEIAALEARLVELRRPPKQEFPKYVKERLFNTREEQDKAGAEFRDPKDEKK